MLVSANHANPTITMQKHRAGSARRVTVQADGAPAKALGYEGNVELVRELTEDNGALAAENEKLQGRCGAALEIRNTLLPKHDQSIKRKQQTR